MEERTLLDEYGTDHGYDFRLDSRHFILQPITIKQTIFDTSADPLDAAIDPFTFFRLVFSAVRIHV